VKRSTGGKEVTARRERGDGKGTHLLRGEDYKVGTITCSLD